MIGPKKLSEVKKELREAFAAEFDDPIQWLEEQMKVPGRTSKEGGLEVLQALKRVLESAPKPTPKKRKKRIAAKK